MLYHSYYETFEFLLKFGKSSCRRVTPVKTGAVSSYFKMFWTPAPVPDSDPGFAGVTTTVDFQRSHYMKKVGRKANLSPY